MASTIPIMSFLRPLGPPRPATIRQFLSFSTSTRCAASTIKPQIQPQQRRPREDRNLTASRTAPSTYPPRSTRSDPRPRISRASQRTAHPPKERLYPTRAHPYATPTPHRLISEPVTPLPEAESAPNLPYFVRRTRMNGLPVYTDRKRGGNLKLTTVRKVDGDASSLRDGLRELLGREMGLDEGRVVVNGVTGHVVVKGHYKEVIEKFLRERRF